MPSCYESPWLYLQNKECNNLGTVDKVKFDINRTRPDITVPGSLEYH